MITKRSKIVQYKQRMKGKMSDKCYAGKKHVKIIQTQQFTGFHNTQEQRKWGFQKLRRGASPVTIKDEQVQFGLPTMTQVVYPGQTIRINTGWKTSDLPADTMMYTYPSQYLLSSDIVGLTQMYGQSILNGELTTTLLNSGTQAVVFQVQVVEGIQQVYRIDEDGNIVQNLGDFNWGQFATAALTTAAKILPIFL